MAREKTNCEDSFLCGKQYSITDRDTKFCQSYGDFPRSEGVQSARLPPRAPDTGRDDRLPTSTETW